MLITFRSKASSSVMLFGDIAVTLLKMAGHSGTVPGAMRSEDIPAAISKLQQALGSAPEQASKPDADDDDETETSAVGLHKRAYPLLQLLSAAAAQQCDVTWEAGAPVV